MEVLNRQTRWRGRTAMGCLRCNKKISYIQIYRETNKQIQTVKIGDPLISCTAGPIGRRQSILVGENQGKVASGNVERYIGILPSFVV